MLGARGSFTMYSQPDIESLSRATVKALIFCAVVEEAVAGWARQQVLPP